MAIWNVKFDKINGETRECKKCNIAFHTMKPIWICCKKCSNANQKILSKQYRDKIGKKEKYPFSTKTNEAGARFCKIRTALSNAWKEYNKTGDKSIIIAHYDKQLKEAEDLGIIKWIFDIRTDEAKRENSLKSRNKITSELPDTRHFNGYEE